MATYKSPLFSVWLSALTYDSRLSLTGLHTVAAVSSMGLPLSGHHRGMVSGHNDQSLSVGSPTQRPGLTVGNPTGILPVSQTKKRQMKLIICHLVFLRVA